MKISPKCSSSNFNIKVLNIGSKAPKQLLSCVHNRAHFPLHYLLHFRKICPLSNAKLSLPQKSGGVIWESRKFFCPSYPVSHYSPSAFLSFPLFMLQIDNYLFIFGEV